MSKEPDFLLGLQLIPGHLVRYIPEDRRPGRVTQDQKAKIRQVLNMRRGALFNRCRGRRNAYVKRFEEAGDFSHSAKGHQCLDCRCPSTAGEDTKGDFYGFGVETGTYGVGLCTYCLRGHRMQPGIALINARREVEMMRAYGEVRDDNQYSLDLAKSEAIEAANKLKAREELDLVLDALTKFKKQLEEADDDKKPTELANGVPVPMSDKTRYELILKFGAAISKLNLDAVKLDASKYLLVDHFLVGSEENQRAVQQAIRMAEQLTIAKTVRGEDTEAGSTPIYDYVWDVYAKTWKAIWTRLMSKVGRQ